MWITDLLTGQNRLRWAEYSLSASWQIVCLSLILGISDISFLLTQAICCFTTMMIGYIIERQQVYRRSLRIVTREWSIWCIAILPFIAFWLGPFAAIIVYSHTPGYLWACFILLFLVYTLFPMNLLLHYARLGPWGSQGGYLFTEQVFMGLSVVAKTTLVLIMFIQIVIMEKDSKGLRLAR
jgi:Heliorhodopsin